MGEDFWDNFLPQLFEGGGGDGLMPGGFDEIGVHAIDEDVEQIDEDAEDEVGNDDDELQAADDDDDDQDTTSEEEEPVPVSVWLGWILPSRLTLLPLLQILPVRMWQNLVNRFWGGQTSAEGSAQ